jgi:hypothetical protein
MQSSRSKSRQSQGVTLGFGLSSYQVFGLGAEGAVDAFGLCLRGRFGGRAPGIFTEVTEDTESTELGVGV